MQASTIQRFSPHSYYIPPPLSQWMEFNSEWMEIFLPIALFLWNVFIFRRAKMLHNCKESVRVWNNNIKLRRLISQQRGLVRAENTILTISPLEVSLECVFWMGRALTCQLSTRQIVSLGDEVHYCFLRNINLRNFRGIQFKPGSQTSHFSLEVCEHNRFMVISIE